MADYKLNMTGSEVEERLQKTKMPNPNALTFTGGVSVSYDGTGAVTVKIPDEVKKVAKAASDTTATIDPNKLYVFPEMSSLTLTLGAVTESDLANEYHVVFKSGATATTLSLPQTIKTPDGFSVEKNKIYELSIMEGCLTYQSWAV